MTHHIMPKFMYKMYKTGKAAHCEIDADGLVLPVDFVCKVIEESDNGGLL